MQTNIQVQQDDLLTIDPSAYFEVEKKQLFYQKFDKHDHISDDEPVNRYALVRKDTGQLLGIHSDDYIVRPYSALAEKVNEIIKDAVPNIDQWKITTEDHVYADGRKFRRNMVRPDWTFTVYNKHSSKQDISYSVAEFRAGLESHQEMGDEMFKMMQKKVKVNDVTELFRKTLANNRKRNLDIDNNSIIVMRDLDSLWGKYVAKYGNTVFAIYQTATDWATHPVTRGAVYNVSRKREKQVAEMMQSDQWNALYN